jgi:predicted CoA-binding protein
VIVMIDPTVAEAFLARGRLAVIGASADRRGFGNTVYRELRDHGRDVVAVNPNTEAVEGDRCYPDLASVPGQIDGAIVMVNRTQSADAVRACAERGVPRVWLFKGLGGGGSVSDEAVELCEQNGLEVVVGACPLMFLEPVGWFHRVHRTVRHLNGSLTKAS